MDENKTFYSFNVDYSYVKETFGEKLLNLRKEKGLKQEQLANYLGISRVALSNYERGERTPDIEILVKAANIFKVSPNYLLGEGPRNKQNGELSLFNLFSEKSIDFLIADNKRSDFLDAILSHKDIEKVADLIYMTHYKPLCNEYETNFHSFLLSQLLYSIVADVARDAYKFSEFSEDSLNELISAIDEYKKTRSQQTELVLNPPPNSIEGMFPNQKYDVTEIRKDVDDWWSYIDHTDAELERIYEKILALIKSK